MIDFYSWQTPNGYKIAIMLEELKAEYKLIPIDIGKQEQFSSDFLKISPNNKIPAIVDHQTNTTMFESGAILIYLAEKSGQFLSKDPISRYKTIEWLMWQMAGFGPMLGQAHHFLSYSDVDVPYAKERFSTEVKRLYNVLDKELSEKKYIASDEYSIVDIATFPWVSRRKVHQIDLEHYPNVQRWYKSIRERDAVNRAYQLDFSK